MLERLCQRDCGKVSVRYDTDQILLIGEKEGIDRAFYEGKLSMEGSSCINTVRVGSFVDTFFRRRIIAHHGIVQIEVANSRRSEEHTSVLQSLLRISSLVFCMTKT